MKQQTVKFHNCSSIDVLYYFTGLAGIFNKVVNIYKDRLTETGRSHLSLADFLALCGQYISSLPNFIEIQQLMNVVYFYACPDVRQLHTEPT